MLLMKMDERSRKTGVMQWTQRTKFESGLYFRSLCQRCNNTYGRVYGGAYVDLVKRIAERIGDVQQFHKVSLPKVKRPLAILKQVMLQFVTTNGASFVRANDWVAPFIRSRTKTGLPPEVCVYLFASNLKSARQTGVSAHVDLRTGKRNVVAEFSFWPLGTVVSFDGELPDNRLTPIHHWADIPFNSNRTVDLELTVNPIASEYPMDFRTVDQIIRQQTEDVDIKNPNTEGSREMMKKAIQVSGDDEGWVFSGHPNTVDKFWY
jgi:hypothetical protein